MKGRRWITLVSAMLCSAAVIAVAAIPASARVPAGQGLTSFGLADCGELGMVEIFGPPAGPATSGYLLDTDGTDPHVVATRFELVVNGQVVFEQNFGTKAGLTTLTCTQTGELFGDVFTLTAAVVPPH